MYGYMTWPLSSSLPSHPFSRGVGTVQVTPKSRHLLPRIENREESIPGVPMVTTHDAALVRRRRNTDSGRDGRGRLRHAMTELRRYGGTMPDFGFGQTAPNHESSLAWTSHPSTAVGGGRLAGGGTPA